MTNNHRPAFNKRVIIKRVIEAVVLGILGVLSFQNTSFAAGITTGITPNTQTLTSGPLQDISCVSSGNCVAVGIQTNAHHQKAAFVLSEIAGTWGSSQSLVGAAGNATSAHIACSSASNCVVVELVANAHHQTQLFDATEANATWTAVRRVPGIPNSVSVVNVNLACTTNGNCAIAGTYSATNSFATVSTGVAPATPFGVVESNGVFHPAQRVAANLGSAFAISVGLACPTTGHCVVTGYYYSHANPSAQAFILSETNASWSPAHRVATNLMNSEPQSVACSTSGNCAIGGTYTTPSGQSASFVTSSVNGTWRPAQRVGANVNNANVSALACAPARPSSCVIVGHYFGNGANPFQVFAATSAGASWTSARSIGAINALSAQLSCPSIGNCVMVGTALNSYSQDQVFAIVQTDGVWGSVVNVTGSLSASSSTVTGLSCSSDNSCAVIGTYKDSSGTSRAFAVTIGS